MSQSFMTIVNVRLDHNKEAKHFLKPKLPQQTMWSAPETIHIFLESKRSQMKFIASNWMKFTFI